MILAEHATKITPREEDRPTTMKALNARLFASMWRNHIDFGS